MSTATSSVTSEMAILRRIVDADDKPPSSDAAGAILRLNFSKKDRARINALAEKNRAGKLTHREEEELSNYLRVGQTLAILQSKARRAIKGASRPPRKS